MIHGATGEEHRINLGHFMPGYWTDNFGAAANQSREAFDEFMSADICNLQSAAVLRKYLPKSYIACRNVLKGVLGG